jgi:hypothetical protein
VHASNARGRGGGIGRVRNAQYGRVEMEREGNGLGVLVIEQEDGE